MATEQQKQMLQYFLSKPLMSAKELQKSFGIIFERNGDMNDLKNMVRDLNELLKPVHLTIKSRLCEDTNEEFFAFISLVESEAAKHTAEFTSYELDFFKHILREILSSESGAVSSIDCINYSSNIPKLSKTEAQKSLDKFFTSLWLKEKEGEVSFTVRTLLELEPLLKQLEPDLTDCTICNCLVVKGIICQNESCGARCHRYCLSKVSRGKSTLKCPVCSNPWASLDASPPPSTQGSTQRSVNGGGGGGRRRTRIQSESDDSD